MNCKDLTKFDKIALLAVFVLDEKAYGVTIINNIQKSYKRKVSFGALRVVLNRLENSKFLYSELCEQTVIRGGKRKRYFRLTAKGKLAIDHEISIISSTEQKYF